MRVTCLYLFGLENCWEFHQKMYCAILLFWPTVLIDRIELNSVFITNPVYELKYRLEWTTRKVQVLFMLGRKKGIFILSHHPLLNGKKICLKNKVWFLFLKKIISMKLSVQIHCYPTNINHWFFTDFFCLSQWNESRVAQF